MVHWGGTPEVVVKRFLDLEKGDAFSISSIKFDSHTGTHMDAPCHFLKGARALDEISLDATIGTARIIQIGSLEAISVAEIESHQIAAGERILFKTENSNRCWKTDQFLTDYVYLSLEAARFLAARKVRAVGVDYLSVSALGDLAGPTHVALLEAGVAIIEGLDLSEVDPGMYKLVCLPLRMLGGDGAPARAIVRPID